VLEEMELDGDLRTHTVLVKKRYYHVHAGPPHESKNFKKIYVKKFSLNPPKYPKFGTKYYRVHAGPPLGSKFQKKIREKILAKDHKFQRF
jgi:hypothetical protein